MSDSSAVLNYAYQYVFDEAASKASISFDNHDNQWQCNAMQTCNKVGNL